MYNTIKEDSIALISSVKVVSLSDTMLLAYMMSRGIDCDIAIRECVELQYELYGKPCNSIGFLNNSGGYILKGVMTQGCFGEQNITIIQNRKEYLLTTCYLFQDFLMYLSFLTLVKKRKINIDTNQSYDYIILNSASNLLKLLSILETYSSIHSFLGNEKVGRVLNDVIVGAFPNVLFKDEMLEFLPSNNLNVYLREMI